MTQIALVLGGARSGKSAFAERLAAETVGDGQVVYVATATAGDAEMAARIRRHRERRPAAWETVEAGLDPVEALAAREHRASLVLLDSLSLWLSNLLLATTPCANETPAEAQARAEALGLAALRRLLDWARACDTALVIVSDEVGLSVVPPYPLGRLYRDLLGAANQMAAAEADSVFLLVAGLPLQLKGASAPSFGRSPGHSFGEQR